MRRARRTPQHFTIRRWTRKHGQPGEVVIVPKIVNARYLDEVEQYKDLLELLFKENLLKTNEGDSVITIYVRYWYDGSSLGSHEAWK